MDETALGTCHSNQTSVIPSHILFDWDSKEHKVCNAAKTFLTSIYSQPLFSLSAINENIFAKARPCTLVPVP